MKNVLITGAYGGMGYKTAKLLASSGFTVYALDKTVGSPENNVIPIKADVTDTNSLNSAYEKVKEIAGELFISLHTVENYVSYIYDKLCVKSRAELEAAF